MYAQGGMGFSNGGLTMVRITDDSTSGQTDHNPIRFQAEPGARIEIPSNSYVSDSQILRDGQDLILRTADGPEIIIENYFLTEPHPLLVSTQGGALTPALVDSFAKPVDGTQMAQKGSIDDSSPIGMVKEVSGDATITHPDGTIVKAAIGTPIYQGDIIETQGSGAVNITFVDETSFAVSENARLAIDEYVFDPATQSGETNFSVLHGVFMFTSGLIGREDPDDVRIETPVGSIGIRGTTIIGDIDANGESQITVVEGAIVVTNGTGEQTLSEQYETVTLAGFDDPIVNEGVLSAEQVDQNYNVLRTVSGEMFSQVDDSTASDRIEDETGETTPESETAPAQVLPTETTDPAATDDTDALLQDQGTQETTLIDAMPITLDTSSGFDTSAGTKETVALDSGITTTATPLTFSATTVTMSTTTNTVSTTTTTTTDTSVTGDNSTTTTTTTNTATTDGSNGGTTTTPPPAFTLSYVSVNPIMPAVAGTTVFLFTSNYPDTVFTWDGTPNPNFEIYIDPLNPNQAEIRISNFGAANLADGNVENIAIIGTLPDTQTTSLSFVHTVVDPNAPIADVDLIDVINGSASVDGFVLDTGAANTGLGWNVVGLGDMDHNGTQDWVFTNAAPDPDARIIVSGMAFDPSARFGLSSASTLSVSGAGDFDGDGRIDFIVGAPFADGGQINSGRVIITTGPTTHISISGFETNNMAGWSVASAGDFNGDGYSDILIGAPALAAGGVGKFYVVFGDGSGGDIDVTASANVLEVTAGGAGTYLGAAVAGIGDFDNDGRSDIAVSEAGTGKVHVHFGDQTLNIPMTISGINVAAGDKEIPVFGMGDMNGDGKSDFGIAETGSNTFHLFYGNETRGGGIFSIGSSNVKFVNTGAGDQLIGAANAGDFNGDGLNDIALAYRTGDMVDVYVVYGRSWAPGTVIDLASMPNGADYLHMMLDLSAFQFNFTDPATDQFEISMTSVGDYNGDGYDDMLIGLPNLDNDSGTHTNDGGIVMVYGRRDVDDVSTSIIEVDGTNNAEATASNQVLRGFGGADFLTSGVNTNTGIRFLGGDGNDHMRVWNPNQAEYNGGAGIDTIEFMTGGTINLNHLNENLSGIERITLAGGATQLTLGLDDVFRLLQSSEDGTLTISGSLSTDLRFDNNDGAATLTPGSPTDLGFSFAGNISGYNHYDFGGYTLMISDTITNVNIA